MITKEEASEMAKTTNGNCTNCGRKGVLSVLHGGKVCNTCRYLLAAANNNVPALAGAVRTVGKTEEMIKALIPEEGKLAVEVTSDMLREISGIVGYTGESPDELVEAVRKAVLRPDGGDCADCAGLRGDLDRSTRVIEELRAKLQEALDANDSLVGEGTEWKDMVGIGNQQLEKLRAKLTLAEQSRDEWEQRAVQAEQNVEALEAELRNAESAPASCANNTYLLDVALAVIREEPVPAGQIASLIEAARGAA